jgi:hypothetical protein
MSGVHVVVGEGVRNRVSRSVPQVAQTKGTWLALLHSETEMDWLTGLVPMMNRFVP